MQNSLKFSYGQRENTNNFKRYAQKTPAVHAKLGKFGAFLRQFFINQIPL